MSHTIKTLLFLAGTLLFFSCKKDYEVSVPDTRWDDFEAAGNQWLARPLLSNMEGVYTIGAGSERFGADAVLKLSYVANGADTSYYLSLFCQKDVSWFLLQGKRKDSMLLFNGYWRSMAGIETGPARLTIGLESGSRFLLNGGVPATGNVVINGVYGQTNAPIDQPLQLVWNRPLQQRNTEIIVHRGGGQSADLLPASENSVEIIPYAARFGATGIEIDVRMTKDNVPILYHDDALSERLIVRNGMVGPIKEYTYDQLNTLVRLVRAEERIPTLRQALEVVLTKTPIRFVWLDTKFNGPMQQVRDMQVEFQQRAAAMGRQLEIVIGIPDTDVANNFKALPNYQSIPSVCELEPADVTELNSRIWAPRWTLGLQNDQVSAVQAQGRRAFVWTLDLPDNIDLFVREGRFNGFLTNYPTAVAYRLYAQP